MSCQFDSGARRANISTFKSLTHHHHDHVDEEEIFRFRFRFRFRGRRLRLDLEKIETASNRGWGQQQRQERGERNSYLKKPYSRFIRGEEYRRGELILDYRNGPPVINAFFPRSWNWSTPACSTSRPSKGSFGIRKGKSRLKKKTKNGHKIDIVKEKMN